MRASRGGAPRVGTSRDTSMSPTEARIRESLRRSSRRRRKSVHPDV